MLIKLQGWEDGVLVRKELQHLDRWEVQAARHVTFEYANTSLTLQQQVKRRLSDPLYSVIAPTAQW